MTNPVPPTQTLEALPAISSRRQRPHSVALAVVLLLVALWANLCRHLSYEWSFNEQYNFGWFVPFFAAYLFWLRWENRPKPAPPPANHRWQAWIVVAVPALFLLLPVRLFDVANPDWRVLGWAHTGMVATLTFLVLWSVGGKNWMTHFAFPVGFFFVAVPWLLTIEVPIVQGLMRLVAMIDVEALALCGIPAQIDGSLIRVSTGVVSINEACSGVRSLQTSLMIGLLFGELKRLSLPRRLVLVFVALAIALFANFGRAFFLVFVAARENVSAVDRWHDVAGYAIVAAVFLGSVAVAALLGRGRKTEKAKDESGKEGAGTPPFNCPIPLSYLALALAWLLAIQIGVEAWYRSHERNLQPALKWTVAWPQSAPGFREILVADRVKGTLHFDREQAATWPVLDPGGGATPARCFLNFFRWEPGSSNILRARAHQPNVCLPNTGWRQIGDAPIRTYAITEKFMLPFRHFSFVQSVHGQPRMYARVFLCMSEDSLRAKDNSAGAFNLTSYIARQWGAADRLKVVLQGLRNPGQQVLHLVFLSPEPIIPAGAETRFAALIPNLISLTAENVSAGTR